jgi:hypothetical protein
LARAIPALEADLTIDYVGSLENAATIISSLNTGEKRLVFCDSRAKTEELSALLRELGCANLRFAFVTFCRRAQAGGKGIC